MGPPGAGLVSGRLGAEVGGLEESGETEDGIAATGGTSDGTAVVLAVESPSDRARGIAGLVDGCRSEASVSAVVGEGMTSPGSEWAATPRHRATKNQPDTVGARMARMYQARPHRRNHSAWIRPETIRVGVDAVEAKVPSASDQLVRDGTTREARTGA